MNKPVFILVALLVTLAAVPQAFAEITPEIQLGVRGTFSLEYSEVGNDGSTDLLNFDDTSVMLGFRQKLFSDTRAKLVVGMKFTDPDSDLGDIYYHHIFTGIQSERSKLMFGRTRARTALLEFPTLRDDDALLYSDALNPFAGTSGIESEEHQFASLLEGSHLLSDRLWFMVWAAAFKDDTAQGAELNAAGINFQYMVPEKQRWNRNIFQQAGIGLISYFDVTGSGGSDVMNNIQASVLLNIKPDPVNFWDLRAQVIQNQGLNGIAALADTGDLTRAKSLSVLGSLRYLNRKSEWPNFQIAGTAGYKSYPDITQDTSQQIIIFNVLKRIGHGYDAGLQVSHQDFEGDLEGIFGEDELTVKAFLTFEFDASWNNQFDDRDSLLNLEHGYIP